MLNEKGVTTGVSNNWCKNIPTVTSEITTTDVIQSLTAEKIIQRVKYLMFHVLTNSII